MLVENIFSENDIYVALSRTRYLIKDLPFSDSDKQAIFVTIMELTRNILIHAGSKGVFTCDIVDNGVRITVRDFGSGIRDLDEILNGSYKSKTGLGLGLAGSKRLMDEFKIKTSSKGTEIVAFKRIKPRRMRSF
ncbi:serine/threonine-protein kinase RsbT [Ammoniphilus resinae]|uniref:Serine/threonine-protein kinase RsbT n=2 Tax=Ammoniphilus resinae TaxID=861532 RepID=A0ABS4GNB4_9BACL|nr:serine/threonine-protein kinase RsbT [Ammoniphilus resinae]